MVKQGTYIYKVSELTSGIKAVLEDSFSGIWVEGEISNFSAPSSGHFYFTLKDDRSELKCAFFKGHNNKIKFEIKDGMHAVLSGKISIFEKRGQYQLIVSAIEPKGVGALQLAFEQLKEKLFKEGLFDEARKRPIPMLPERIGIITSPTGAVIRDMLHVLEKRFPNVEVLINPVRVQGEGAGEEIAGALEDFNKLKNVDVIIAGRGGGSIEDLWAFNEEVVARAIYNSDIPVISAVGHEIDWTISDFVADMRAPTPSLAAERVIVNKSDLIYKLDDIKKALAKYLLDIVKECEQRLDETDKTLSRYPLDALKEYERRLDDIAKDMGIGFKHYMELKERGFELVSEKIGILSPVGILGRGYSISFKLPGREIIKKASGLKKGDMVETVLSKGSFKGRVEDTYDKRDEV